MEQFMTSLYNLITTWQPLVWILAAIALFAIGVAALIPNDKCKNFAKEHWPFIVIGIGLALGAVTIAKEIAAAFVF